LSYFSVGVNGASLLLQGGRAIRATSPYSILASVCRRNSQGCHRLSEGKMMQDGRPAGMRLPDHFARGLQVLRMRADLSENLPPRGGIYTDTSALAA
jgi:hypothetical protein